MNTATETKVKQSRLGKRPIKLPEEVKVSIVGNNVTVQGPKGTLERTVRQEVLVEQESDRLLVKIATEADVATHKFQGLSRALLANMVEGVSAGFRRSMDLRGVGYRAELKDGLLVMALGLSHSVSIELPPGVSLKIEQIDQGGIKFPRVHLESADKEVLGALCAKIRNARPPEPYKGKGVRYTGETIPMKAGKAGKK